MCIPPKKSPTLPFVPHSKSTKLYRFLTIGTLLLTVFIAFLVKSLATFEGGPHNGVRPIPKEAVPLYQMSEVHWFVRYILGYLFGVLAPISTMNKCPTVVDWDNKVEAEAAHLCMKKARDMEALDVAMTNLTSMFDEEIIYVDRPGVSGDPMKVTLLKKENSKKVEDAKAPLILWIHGGGFVMRGSHISIPAQVFTAFLKMDEDENINDSSVMESATMALVEYRLAPEAVYPASTDDCLLALNHLVHNLGLGKGGIHVGGPSAGATLAIETTLKSLDLVDTFYADAPVVLFPTKYSNEGNAEEWALDSASVRRYSYARVPAVPWLEWSIKAYTGVETDFEKEKDLQLGTLTTKVDITGGSMTVSEWLKRTSSSTTLPRLFLVTAKGDPLHDGGLAFKSVYEQVIEEFDAKYINLDSVASDEMSTVKYFDSNHGHCLFYIVEPSLFHNVMKEWQSEIRDVWEKKN